MLLSPHLPHPPISQQHTIKRLWLLLANLLLNADCCCRMYITCCLPPPTQHTCFCCCGLWKRQCNSIHSATLHICGLVLLSFDDDDCNAELQTPKWGLGVGGVGYWRSQCDIDTSSLCMMHGEWSSLHSTECHIKNTTQLHLASHKCHWQCTATRQPEGAIVNCWCTLFFAQ